MQKQSKTIQWKWLYHIQSCKKFLNDPMKIGKIKLTVMIN